MATYKKLLVGLGVLLVGLVGLIVLRGGSSMQQSLGLAGFQVSYYNLIGTPSAPVTATASYASNSSTLVLAGSEYLSYDIDYRPASLNSYLQILVEVSRDGGVTYRPWGSTQISTSSISIYNGPSSTFQGVPIQFPGELTSVSGTLYRTSEPNFDVIATHVRTLVREVTSSTFGTVYIGTTVSSKR